MLDDQADVEAIRSRIAEKRVAYAARRPEGSYNLFLNSNDVCVYDLCQPLYYYSWDAVRRITEEFVEATEGPLDVDSGVPEILVSGELAVSWSIVRVRTVLTGGRPVDIQMRQTNAWRRVDGQWFIVHEHNSQPLDHDATQKLLGISKETTEALPTQA
jgi:ketosteroid isomerase-like protein